ncbi:two-component sensor histidine kinase [Desulfuromonas versatilis]|uniref:histidine kinase n=1 Tax=Desulfuromonas versatilis TaxID=2802975 RepID=A0ABM8HUN5_9BACT|nr:cache domain-containing protein [Desulfuromonas versatilis]BCR05639.1 two-component sensor histidine kinase [Desulfuromonas versatilis]
MTRPDTGAFSIRGKMTLAALTPLAAILLLVAFAAFYLINAWIVGQTQQRVRNDLNAAHEVLGHERERVLNVVRFTANSSALAEDLDAGRLERVAGEMKAILLREKLDVLTLTDAQGRVLLRAANPEAGGGEAAPLPLLGQVLAGEDFSGTLLLASEQVLAEGEDLAHRARVHLRPPFPADRPAVEARGMLLAGASAVKNPDGRTLGVLYGGVLLNGNLALVDRIKQIVYGNQTFEGTEVGSATIFLEDLRVATTIRLSEGSRAMGTRVSTEVADAVLGRGETWLARARVVDKWYLTAYEPLRDPGGRAIGALYVGLLEKPFTALKHRAALALLGLLVLGCGLGFLVARLVSSRVSRPILELESAAERIARGERDVALPVPGKDEVGHLIDTFKRMTGNLQQRDEQLRELNRQLEVKVQERTAQLEEKSLQLIQAQEELLRSEKLAAIGSLAAGVAHEINNPAAIIRGNVEILLMDIPVGADGREEAEEILKQTERISLITRNMLTFAREQEIHPEMIQVNSLLGEILDQVGHQAPLDEVAVEKYFTEVPPIVGDYERLRQVFTNILVNALQAMEGRGTLRIATDSNGKAVEIAISDSGPGIPAEIREKIFNPFFTTKRTGTGLGLSVSYGIIKALGGVIEIESQEGEGSTFRVRLPVEGGE